MMAFQQTPWFATADRSQRWLVGVSGGADSVALLHLLVEMGFGDLVVCHLDHGLRVADSAGDAGFVRGLAEMLGLACEVGRADVLRRMEQRGESMETAARHERHLFFADCGMKFDCPRLLLAHHEDDQAETVLWNLLRGSHGMKGMREVQEITAENGFLLQISRPLLGVRRRELVDWLEERGREWREDLSNAEPVAVRNRLRNEALPLLSEISGRDAVGAFSRGAREAGEMGELVTWALARAEVLDPQGRLHVPVLRRLPVALQRAAIFAFLREAGVSDVSEALLGRLAGQLDSNGPPAENLPGGFRMRRRAARMFLERDA
jgi:tRNA(Ile)-lysidine synthase